MTFTSSGGYEKCKNINEFAFTPLLH